MSGRFIFELLTAVPLAVLVSQWVQTWPINPFVAIVASFIIGVLAAVAYLAVIDLVLGEP